MTMSIFAAIVFFVLFLYAGITTANHFKESYLFNYEVAKKVATDAGEEFTVSPDYPAKYSAVVIMVITACGLFLMALGVLIPILGALISFAGFVAGIYVLVTVPKNNHAAKGIRSALMVFAYVLASSVSTMAANSRNYRAAFLLIIGTLVISSLVSRLVLKLKLKTEGLTTWVVAAACGAIFVVTWIIVLI